jgi:hypothetical protein
MPSDQWRPAFAPAGRVADDGATIFRLSSVPPGAGQYHAQYRVFPHHPLLSHPLELGLIKTL